MPDPKNPGDRTKAYKLRKQLTGGAPVADVDKLWLAEYDERTQANGSAASKHYGRSRSGRKIQFQLEEAAEAEGTGNAAAAAAAAALQAKEEGRRLDALTVNALEGYKQLVKDQREWMQEIRRNERAAQRRVEKYEQTHVAMIDAVRESLIARTNAEVELMRTMAERENGQDPANDLFHMLLERNGLALPANGKRPDRPRRRPPSNGTTEPRG